jgi:hypothetical protein
MWRSIDEMSNTLKTLTQSFNFVHPYSRFAMNLRNCQQAAENASSTLSKKLATTSRSLFLTREAA